MTVLVESILFECDGCERNEPVRINNTMTPSEQIEAVYSAGCPGIIAQFIKYQLDRITGSA